MTIPRERFSVPSGDASVEAVGYENIKTNGVVNASVKAIDRFGPGETRPRINSNLISEGQERDWISSVKNDLYRSVSTSTVDGLNSNTIIKASSMPSIDDMFISTFKALCFPDSMAFNYRALSQIDKLRLLKAITETGAGGIADTMLKHPFFSGDQFSRNLVSGAESNPDELAAIKEIITSGIISFGYSNNQKGSIGAINRSGLSEKSKRNVAHNCIVDAIKRSDTQAILDIASKTGSGIIGKMNTELGTMLGMIDGNPANIDRSAVIDIAKRVLDGHPSDMSVAICGGFLGKDYPAFSEERTSWQPNSGGVLELSDSGWNTALMGFSSGSDIPDVPSDTYEFSDRAIEYKKANKRSVASVNDKEWWFGGFGDPYALLNIKRKDPYYLATKSVPKTEDEPYISKTSKPIIEEPDNPAAPWWWGGSDDSYASSSISNL